MALVIGQNSWQTVEEADLYLTDRLGSQSWFLLEDSGEPGEPSKEVYLIMAFNLLVHHPGYFLDADMSNDNVKKAQSELALYFVDNYLTFISQSDLIAQGISGFTLSKWKQDFTANWQNDYPLPVWVSSYIAKFNSTNAISFLEAD